MKYQPKKRALILLADGTIFYGKSVGIKKERPLVKFVSIPG